MEVSTEGNLNDLLFDVAFFWKDFGNVNQLKVILCEFDRISKAHIEKCNEPYDLLNLLIGPGIISQSNVNVLIEAAELGDIHSVESKIMENVPSFLGFDNYVIHNFSIHRQNLMNFGKRLGCEAINRIAQLYKIKRPSDQWDLIFKLEKKGKLTEETKDAFIKRLTEKGMGVEANAFEPSAISEISKKSTIQIEAPGTEVPEKLLKELPQKKPATFVFPAGGQNQFLLYDVSDELGKRNVCIDQLKFALFDFILRANLEAVKSPFDIFSELGKTRNPPEVINILIALFKLLWLDALNDIFFKSGFPTADIQPTNVFSPFRISIVNMSNHLQNNKINMIAGVFKVPNEKCVNQWKLLQYLQDEGELNKGNFIRFVERFEINKDTLEWQPAEAPVLPSTEANQSVLENAPELPTPTAAAVNAPDLRARQSPTSVAVLSQTRNRSGDEEHKFREFLGKLSWHYRGILCLWLRFLLSDVLPTSILSEGDISGMYLFNGLEMRGHISCTNVTLLSEICDITEMLSAKQCVEAYIQETECQKGKGLTAFRKNMFKALMDVTDTELRTLIACYNLSDFNFHDIWDLVFHLEINHNLDTTEKWEMFAIRLNNNAKAIVTDLRATQLQTSVDVLSQPRNSKKYPGKTCRWLRFLLYDHLPTAVLSQTDLIGMYLFNELTNRGHISPTNVTILEDISEATERVEAKQCVDDYKQETQCWEGEGLKPFRMNMFKALMNVTDTEVQVLVANYNLCYLNFDNVWDLVFHLQMNHHLDTTKEWKMFTNCLNNNAKAIITDALAIEMQVKVKEAVNQEKEARKAVMEAKEKSMKENANATEANKAKIEAEEKVDAAKTRAATTEKQAVELEEKARAARKAATEAKAELDATKRVADDAESKWKEMAKLAEMSERAAEKAKEVLKQAIEFKKVSMKEAE